MLFVMSCSQMIFVWYHLSLSSAILMMKFPFGFLYMSGYDAACFVTQGSLSQSPLWVPSVKSPPYCTSFPKGLPIRASTLSDMYRKCGPLVSSSIPA